jgi:molecular chaperone GrpE (heat shock protein)
MNPRAPSDPTRSPEGGIPDSGSPREKRDSLDPIDPDGMFAALDALREQVQLRDDAPGVETRSVEAVREDTGTSTPALRAELAELRLLFEQKILRDQTLQGIIGRLHESLIDAQADLALKFLRPVLLEIIKLRDELAALVPRDDPSSPTFKDLLQDVDDLLDRQGAIPFECPGDRVDPSLQRVKKTEPAEDPSDAGKITKRLRPGFRYYDKIILRPEEVVALAKPTIPRADLSGGPIP